jgi:hypothetical protein
LSRPVRIFVSPAIADRWRPELVWTAETLLTGIGRPWNMTTDSKDDCDVAYAAAGEHVPNAVVRLPADPEAWGGTRSASDPGAAGRLAGWSSDVQSRNAPGDPLADCFTVLSGRDEAAWKQDRHGHHLPPDAAAGRRPREAVVSAFARMLSDTLRPRLGPAPHTPWPDGTSFAAVATHDVDYPTLVRWLEPFRIARRAGTASGAALGALTGRLHHWHFRSWTDCETRLGIRSAFFFVPRRGSLARYAAGTPDPFYDIRRETFRMLFGELVGQGFEIGLQASYRACERPDEILRQKQILEAAAGHTVAGGRHHYWRLDPADPEETLLAHERAGLLYDCTLAFERLLGWRRGVTWPFHPFSRRLRRPIATLQLQTAWMDNQLFGHASFNATPTPEARAAALDGLVARAKETSGVLVTDVHEYVFDERLFPGWRAASDRLWGDLAARSDVWIAPPAVVTERWIGHEERIRAESRSLR